MPAHFLSSLTLSLAFSTLLTKDHSSVGSRFNPCPSKDFRADFRRFIQSYSSLIRIRSLFTTLIYLPYLSRTTFSPIFFSHASFFFPSFDLRIPRLFLKKKKRKSLLYPIYLICLAISLETCHVNNNAQLYTIRPSFTAAYLGIFQKKKKYASRFTNPDSTILEFSRATPRGDTRGIDRRPSSRSSLFDTRAKLRSIDRSIDRCQSIERK